MPSPWILALKKYNEGQGTWCLPKKGYSEHAEVMKIMAGMKGSKGDDLTPKKKCAKKKGEDCKCDVKPAPAKKAAVAAATPEEIAAEQERLRKVYRERAIKMAEEKAKRAKKAEPKKKQQAEGKLMEKHNALERVVVALVREVKTATGAAKKKLEKELEKRREELNEIRGQLLMASDSDSD